MNGGITFTEALGIIEQVARDHCLASESLALPRTHGRVLARGMTADVKIPSFDIGATDDREVLRAGQVLTPTRVAMAAALGLASLQVARRPAVAVFTSGNNLVEPGMPLATGHVYDSNRELLMGLLRADGMEPTAWPRLPDDPRQVEIALRDAGCAFDLILACGQIAADRHDHVASVVAQFGQSHFQLLQIQPGMPVLFASLDQARLLVLPGDPVSVLAGYLTLGRALIDGLQGRLESRLPWRARLTSAVAKTDPRREFRRASIFSDGNGLLLAEPSTAADSNALIVLPEGPQWLTAGDPVEVVGHV